ncbi:MAG TPA: prepilin-type N-terminal cleavage/methylation domain-containing protein [Burkholderiaceae bacterium]|nr:prepilin-type N-terminal cleavage/methylation domain-containing protein [Burkholderiaceae bacterium]
MKKPRATGAKGREGFTLVEVLVAMTVMAIMAVMAWQGVDGIVRARDASQVRLERTLRLNTVVAQWDQDLASIQDSSAVPQALACDGASVRMVRRTPEGLQIVAWSLRPDASGGAWVRWAGPAVTTAGELQDSWLRSLQLQGGEPGALQALTGIAGWQVYFYQGNAWANCQSSGNRVASIVMGGASAPPATRTALPSGVRAVLSFAAGSGLNGDLTRDTLVGP